MKIKGLIITLAATVILIGLIIWGSSLQNKNIQKFGETDIACLTNGHQRIVDHIHPTLKITVDGEQEVIPANIGITQDCMPEIHTHDGTGGIHVESFLPGRVSEFNLSHFFLVWDKNPEREGFDLEILQDGEVKDSISDVKMIDHSAIELKYTSSSDSKE